MWIVILGVIAYIAFKVTPGRILKDVLELEWMRELQSRRNMRPMTCEALDRKWLRQLTVRASVFGAVVAVLALAAFHSLPIGVLLGSVGGVTTAKLASLRTRHYREVVQPLYLTLCGLPGMLWDTHSPARKWVHVSHQGRSGSVVTVRLPKEWHSSERGVKSIAQCVSSRIPGREWTTRLETTKFRIVMTEQSITSLAVDDVSVVPVAAGPTGSPAITSPTATVTAPATAPKSTLSTTGFDLVEETGDDNNFW
jgi:hypothetical protein